MGNEKLLHHTTDGVRWTQCAFGPDGVLWIVYVQGDTNKRSGGPIWVFSYDGTTVTEPFNATGTYNVKGNRPNISVSNKGHVIVVWGVVADNATYMRIRNPKTKTWGAIETVCYNYGGDEPVAQMDKDGNIHVFMTDEAGGMVFVRSKINGTWGGIKMLNEQRGKQGSLAVAPNGTVHAIWIEKTGEGSYQNVYTNRTVTTEWYRREALPKVYSGSNHPWITVGPNNKAVAIYQGVGPTENGSEIWVLKLGTAPQSAFPFYMVHFPRVAVDINNKIHAVVQLGGGDSGTGFRYTNNVSGEWAPHQTIEAVFPKVQGISANSFGNVAITTSSFTAPREPGTNIMVYSLEPIQKVVMPEADFTFSPTTGYPPLTVGIHGVHAVGPNDQEVTYDWTFSEGGTATGRDITHTYATHGTYTITLTITDNLGRTDEISKTITVNKTNPQVPLNPNARITMSSLWNNPQITFDLVWEINPANVPAHIEAYAIYMKEGDGEYVKVLTVSPTTLDASFPFTDLSVKRAFAISTLGYGGTESSKVYFQ